MNKAPWRGRGAAVAGVAVALFLATACGQAPVAIPATPTPAPLPPLATIPRLDLSGYQFTPNVIEVTRGQRTKFELAGDGLAHTFTIQAIGVDIPVAEGSVSQAVEFLVPADASGELALVCRLHELAGMVATLRVR